MDRVNGFSLIEITLSIAILAIVISMGVPLYYSIIGKNNVDIVVHNLVDKAQRAQVFARANNGNVPWGIYISTSSFVLFRGAGYAMRDSSYDEVVEFSPAIQHAGVQEFVFNRYSGLSNSTGTILFFNSQQNQKTIILTREGIME